MPEMYEIIIFSLELVVPFIILTIVLSAIILGRKKRDKKSLQKLIGCLVPGINLPCMLSVFLADKYF